MSIWGYGRERNGILGNLLNTHPMALKYLMPALMHFYIGKLQCCLTWSEALPGQRWNKLAQALSSMTNLVRDLSILRGIQLTGRSRSLDARYLRVLKHHLPSLIVT